MGRAKHYARVGRLFRKKGMTTDVNVGPAVLCGSEWWVLDTRERTWVEVFGMNA